MTKLQEKKIKKFQTSGKLSDEEEMLSYVPGPTWDIYNKKLGMDAAIAAFTKEFPNGTREEFYKKYPQFTSEAPKLLTDHLKNTPVEKLVSQQMVANTNNYQRQTADNYQKQLSDLYKSQLHKNSVEYANLVKPLTAAASLIMNLNQLKKTRDEALNIKAPIITAPAVPNRPVEALPPEIENLYLSQVGDLQSKKTSDSTANAMGEQMLTLNKIGALGKLTAAQTENLQKERARHDDLDVKNALATVDAMNKQAELSAAIGNQKAGIRSGYESSKQDILNRWIEEGIIKPSEKLLAHREAKKMLGEAETWNRVQNRLNTLMNAMRIDPANAATYKDELDKLLKTQGQLTENNYEDYS